MTVLDNRETVWLVSLFQVLTEQSELKIKCAVICCTKLACFPESKLQNELKVLIACVVWLMDREHRVHSFWNNNHKKQYHLTVFPPFNKICYCGTNNNFTKNDRNIGLDYNCKWIQMWYKQKIKTSSIADAFLLSPRSCFSKPERMLMTTTWLSAEEMLTSWTCTGEYCCVYQHSPPLQSGTTQTAMCQSI